MKRVFGGLIAVVAITFLMVSPAQAAPATPCTTTLTGVTTGSLTVPGGAVCTLDGVIVNGDIRVLARGALLTSNSTVNGNIRGEGARTVQVIDTDVMGTGSTGNINLQGTNGKIVIGNAGCRADPPVGNNITLIDNHGTIAVCYMTLGETLVVQDNDKRIGLANNVVGNSMNVQGNTADRINIRNNDVGSTGGGSMNVQDNTTTIRLVLMTNHVGNNLNCTGNVAAPVGSGNSADNGMHDQCAALG